MSSIRGTARGLVAAWAGAIVALAAACFVDSGPADDGTSGATTGTSTTGGSSTTQASDPTLTTTTGTGAETITATASTTDATGEPASCGNGKIEGGEACDAGDLNADDALCKSDCTLNVCGDGDQGPGEGCDDGNLDDGDGCSGACVAESCGDGIVQVGEECDDGNLIDDDGCTAACTLPACGDGVIQEGEACDDGRDNGPSGACTGSCVANVCGDQMVFEGVEECDDGNQVDTDECTNACTAAVCGDGLVHEGVEACDDGNAVDDDGCTNACTLGGSRVFVTSGIYSGNLGGIVGADQKCQAHAQQVGLPGIWRAWISVDKLDDSPAVRFKKSNGPYLRLDGAVIATGWGDLIDGQLLAPIDITEKGVPATGANAVWTNTSASGVPANQVSHCSSWQTGSPGVDGRIGSRIVVNSGWSAGAIAPCASSAHLYCFEEK
ncbi:MAG: DUF4215 domain-containing protein [Nannocystaceae bacterium]